MTVSCWCIEAMVNPDNGDVLFELGDEMQKCDSQRSKIRKYDGVFGVLNGELHDFTGLAVSELTVQVD
jgi:hypothetical protein